MPYFRDAHRLPAEDVFGLEASPARALTTRVPARSRRRAGAAPHIANFDDFDPLRLEPGVEPCGRRTGPFLPPADTDLVILSGSKATIADLAALRPFGWDVDIKAHVRRGGRVLGICGGYQMLGL